MLLLGIVLWGMLIGWIAQLIVKGRSGGTDWPLAFGAGIGGSFVGGLLTSLLAGDGLALRPSGIFGSLAGAIIVTVGWLWWRERNAAGSGA